MPSCTPLTLGGAHKKSKFAQFSFVSLAMHPELKSTALNLVNYAGKILPYTPCSLHDVAAFLAAQSVTNDITHITKYLLALSERYPSIMILERENLVGRFLIFYHEDALRALLSFEADTRNRQAVTGTELNFLDNQPISYISDFSSQLSKLLNSKSALEQASYDRQVSKVPVIPNTLICESSSYSECMKAGKTDCANKIHLERVASSSNEASDCSYLDTCFKGKQCKYVHYKTRFPDKVPQVAKPSYEGVIEPQYINANLLNFDLKLLGNDYKALIIDPPWDIHTKPGAQGGCSDSDVLNLPIESLQSDGVVFLWVTGRVLDLGRHCLQKWGYNNVEELIWLKINQLGKTICTGRTGHWLNHTKEHVLVGTKGNVGHTLKCQFDSDVMLSSALGRSQKPEELYGIIDRIAGKYSKKLELFGRKSNIRQGWITIGNEMGSTHIVEPQLRAKLQLDRVKF